MKKHNYLVVRIICIALAVLVAVGAGAITAKNAAAKKAVEGAVTVTGTAQGVFGDDVVVQVTLDAEKIYDITVLEQNETPELGGKACETLPAQMVEANSIAVDGYSGATMTSNALKEAVSQAIQSAGFNPANFGGEDSGSVTLQATEPGVFGEDVVVEVTLDANTIYSVKVISQNETPELGGQACETLPDQIVAANSVAVDGYSGATMTSNAIKNAVLDCIEEAGFDPANFGGEGSDSAAEEATEPAAEESAAPTTDENGRVTVQATEQGIGGDVTVQVTLDATTIYDVTVLEQNETPALGGVACEQMPAQFVEANSVDIDGVSGATVTSTALKKAVTDCIEEAGFDPANYNGPVAEAAAADTAAPDGAVTVQATEQGIGGDVTVEVTLDASTIYNVTVLEQNETPALGGVACEQMPAQFVEANSVDIDGVSGATVTSTALKKAVTDCIEAAGFDPSNYNGPVAAAAAENTSAASDTDGKVTVQASAEGYKGDITVEVTMDASTIYSITIVSQNENWTSFNAAINRLPGKMVSANSVAVDDVSGATVTSTAIKNAVIECIKTAGFDPANFGA